MVGQLCILKAANVIRQNLTFFDELRVLMLTPAAARHPDCANAKQMHPGCIEMGALEIQNLYLGW